MKTAAKIKGVPTPAWVEIAISVLAGGVIACAVEHMPVLDVCKALIFGYHPTGEGLSAILDGGGLLKSLLFMILAMSMSFPETVKRHARLLSIPLESFWI